MSTWRLELDPDDKKCHVYENGVERHDVVSIAVTKEIGQTPRLWLTLTPERIEIEGDLAQMPTRTRRHTIEPDPNGGPGATVEM